MGLDPGRIRSDGTYDPTNLNTAAHGILSRSLSSHKERTSRRVDRRRRTGGSTNDARKTAHRMADTT